MLEIRPAALSEFALLPAIEAEADLAFATVDPPMDPNHFPPPGDPEDYAAAFHIMVAGRPPGAFVRLEVVDGQAHLAQIAVIPGFARQGIGRSLVNAAKAWAQESGFHAITLSTFAEVPFNAPFYTSCGFTVLPARLWGAEIMELRHEEAALGMDDFGPRVVMRALLTHD